MILCNLSRLLGRRNGELEETGTRGGSVRDPKGSPPGIRSGIESAKDFISNISFIWWVLVFVFSPG